MRMPRDKDEFEQLMLWAFSAGMNAGYGIEHTNITDEEEAAIEEFAEQNDFKRKMLER